MPRSTVAAVAAEAAVAGAPEIGHTHQEELMAMRTGQSGSAGAVRPAAGDGEAWLVLVVLLLFSIAAPLNQFKVPPIMTLLMGSLRVSVGQAGLLMSVYAITGLVLALPAGLIFQRAGYRLTCLLAGGSICIGAAWGAVSVDLPSLMLSRVVEGIGTSFMAVLAPAVIAAWFLPERRGAAMGVWSAWVPVGSAAMLAAAPLLARGGSWRPAWWAGCGYALVTTILALALARPSPAAGARVPESVGTNAELSTGQVLRHRDVWLLGLAFGCFNLVVLALVTYLPTFLGVTYGVSLQQAGLLTGIPSLVSIFAGAAGGVLSDRIGSRKRVSLAGLLVMAAAMPLTVVIAPTVGLVLLLVVQGLAMGLVPTNIFSAAVEMVGGGRRGGLAMGIIMVGQNAGFLLGPVVFGLLVQSSGGWPLAYGSLAAMSLVGAAAAAATRQ
jgi:MFS family permease